MFNFRRLAKFCIVSIANDASDVKIVNMATVNGVITELRPTEKSKKDDKVK